MGARWSLGRGAFGLSALHSPFGRPFSCCAFASYPNHSSACRGLCGLVRVRITHFDQKSQPWRPSLGLTVASSQSPQ